jgi:hypothetical protein
MGPPSRAAALLLAGAISAVAIPLSWTRPELINGRGDFTQYAARHEHLRGALLGSGVWPEWSHLLGGGYPILGDPEDPGFSPLALLTLAFGTVTGLKLVGVLAMLAFGLGVRALLRRDGLPEAAAVIGGAAAGLSLWIPVRMEDGNPNEVGFAILPWILLALREGGRRRLLFAVLLLLTLLMDGKLAFVVVVQVLGLFVLTGLAAGPDRAAAWRWLLRLAGTGAATAILALPRLLPALELLEERGGVGSPRLWFHAAEYGPSTISAYAPGRLLFEAAGIGGAVQGSLTSVCVGPVALLLAMIGILANARRLLPLALPVLLCAWLALAHRAPFDLFRLLWELPVLRAIDAPGKYFSFPVVLGLAVASGHGAASVIGRLPAPRRRAAGLLLGLLVAAPLARETWKVHARTYSTELPAIARQRVPEFYTVRSDGLWRGRSEPWNANTYVNVLRGVGTLDWYTGIPRDEVAIPRTIVRADGSEIPEPAWRGEAWVQGTGRPLRVRIRYHEIELEERPPEGEVAVINQSAHQDWTASGGRIVPAGGLLAVEADGGQGPIRLRFRSRSLRLGARITGSCILLVAALAPLLAWRRRRARSFRHGPESTR